MRNTIEKIAIANRGEVAVRIIRACQELGIETVLLHSDIDENSLAYRLADERVCIGPAPTAQSYLDIEANIQGAISSGADAIHPGFGFLSENAEFAARCEESRLIFIGPSAEAIRLFGDKISAKKLVEGAKGPVIPGYQGDDQSEETLLKKAEEIGFPVIIKATAGGGGRGLKVATSSNEARSAIASARREAKAAFGSDKLFIEKYLDAAKHIEVQIFGDATGRVYHLFERECSVQRRHQKIIEEALSPTLNQSLRQKICETAVRIGESAGYRGAGTVEFLVQNDQFYFLEMNTRLQVEHPVTELVVGVDLVKAQIITAMGQGLLWDQADLVPRGHAIECRLYAEDPYQGGLPSTGELIATRWPHGPGRRFEVGFEPGDEITSYYDPMFAKVIVWDESRPRAIQKMKMTLQESIIFGVHTNIPYLLEILSHPEFVDGTMNTSFIGQYFPEGLSKQELDASELELAEALWRKTNEGSIKPGEEPPPSNPWVHGWDHK